MKKYYFLDIPYWENIRYYDDLDDATEYDGDRGRYFT